MSQGAENQGQVSQTLQYLNELYRSEGWKYLVQSLTETKQKITDTVMTPLTDQSLKFNADEILKQRSQVLDLILELPTITIKDFENRLFVMTQRAKSLEKRLEEYGEQFASDAKEKGLIQ